MVEHPYFGMRFKQSTSAGRTLKSGKVHFLCYSKPLGLDFAKVNLEISLIWVAWEFSEESRSQTYMKAEEQRQRLKE